MQGLIKQKLGLLLLGIFTFILPFNAYSSLALAAQVSSPKSSDFRVLGNKIYSPDGKQFIAEGISVFGGLEDSNYMVNIPNIRAQIEAAVKFWHTNTIRLQVAESNLFSRGINSQYNEKFLKQIINEVNFARRLNQVVVINDQTEFTNNSPSPTIMTSKFWYVIGKTFSKDPYVIFDLFNEPRLDSLNAHKTSRRENLALGFLKLKRITHKRRHVNFSTNPAKIWSIWKYGGYVNSVHYVGMQTLVNQIRNRGVNNLIWVESPYWGQRLPPSKQYLITGNNVVYSYHHINLNYPSGWQSIGMFSKNHAVVDGEWSQYQSPWAECYSHAPLNTPKYLRFLQTNKIGLIAWSLQAGSLIKGNPRIIPSNVNSLIDTKNPNSLRIPSRFSRHYSCNRHFGYGAGKLIMKYFLANSSPI